MASNVGSVVVMVVIVAIIGKIISAMKGQEKGKEVWGMSAPVKWAAIIFFGSIGLLILIGLLSSK